MILAFQNHFHLQTISLPSEQRGRGGLLVNAKRNASHFRFNITKEYKSSYHWAHQLFIHGLVLCMLSIRWEKSFTITWTMWETLQALAFSVTSLISPAFLFPFPFKQKVKVSWRKSNARCRKTLTYELAIHISYTSNVILWLPKKRRVNGEYVK